MKTTVRSGYWGCVLLAGMAWLGFGWEPGRALAAGRLPTIRVAEGGAGFVANERPVVLMGVNYFRPGTGWAPQVWKQFDPAATREDFARLRDLGANCVRVFLTYGSFMTEPGVVLESGLTKLDRFLELAEEAGLYVNPTGPDHWEGLPDWTRTDRLADDTVLEALEGFWRTVAGRYRGRSVLFAYDLLNEPEVGWDSPAMRSKWNRWLKTGYGDAGRLAAAWAVAPETLAWGEIPPPPREEPPGARLLDYQRFREHLATEWTRRQATAIREADPEALVTVGLIQWSVPAVLAAAWQYSGFRPAQQAPMLDFLKVHFYPLATGFYEYRSALDEARNLAYLESVVLEVARPGKPVLLGEFGWYGGGRLTIHEGRHPPASEAQQARWCRLAVESTAGLAHGWLNWGLYDHPEARDVTQLLGLFTVDGRLKEWGRTFERLTRRFAEEGPPGPPRLERPVLDWEACLQDPAARTAFREAWFEAWQKAPPIAMEPWPDN